MKSRATLHAICAIALGLCSTTWAEDRSLPGRFEIEIGGYFVTKIDTVALFARKAGPIEAGTLIDFSKDLGLADSKSIPRVDGLYRFNRKSSVSFSLWDIERDATVFLGTGIDFGDISIPVGELVESAFDATTIRASYGYSFYNVPKAELGINVGLHLTTFDLGINCLSCSNEDLVDFESVSAPLPVLGLHFRYQMSRRWAFSGYTQHFLFAYGEFDGSLTDTRVAFSHHTFKNVGFGFGWNRIQTDIDIDSSEYLMVVDNKLDGIQAYIVVYAGRPKHFENQKE